MAKSKSTKAAPARASRRSLFDPPPPPAIPARTLPDLEPAVGELRHKVWCLRSLIDCLQLAEVSGAPDDLYAAFRGVLELADSIHVALDFQALTRRAVEIAEAEIKASTIARFTADDMGRTVLEGLPPALACPFCGQTEDIMIHEEEDDETSESGKWYRVGCGTCGVDAPGGATQAEAATEWNTRGIPPSERAVREAAQS